MESLLFVLQILWIDSHTCHNLDFVLIWTVFRAVFQICGVHFISGVKTLHLMLNAKVPDDNSFQLELVFRGTARNNPHMPNRALPMTPQILEEMYSFLDAESPEDVTYWCLFLLMLFLMGRKSNMVPVSVADFDPKKQLLRQDIKLFKGF